MSFLIKNDTFLFYNRLFFTILDYELQVMMVG